jgi:hypothetical protein
MGNIISTNKINKDKIKYLAEEVGIPLNFDITKINGIVSPEIVYNININIKKIQPIIQIGINKFKLTALLSKITSDILSYDDYLNTPDGKKAASDGSNLPKTFFISNILLPVRNQGQTNCCVAYATACAIEYKNIMTKKYLDYLSPAFIYTNRNDTSIDDGMTSIDAISIVKKYGVSTDKFFPMEKLNKSIQPYVYDDAQKYKVTQYNYIVKLDTLKIALFNNGPVMAILPVYNSTTMFWKNNATINNTDIGYHCISIIGFDDVNEQLLIRNSWGTNWGMSGNTWFPYSDFKLIVESWTLHPEVPQPDTSLYLTVPFDDYNSDSNLSNQIIGLDPEVFYSLLAGIIIFIIIIIIIIIIRYKQSILATIPVTKNN